MTLVFLRSQIMRLPETISPWKVMALKVHKLQQFASYIATTLQA